MSSAISSDSRGIEVTGNAAKRIVTVMAGEQPGAMLRVSVAGGGCSGFQYVFDVEREKAPDDLVIERDGAIVLIDETSVDLLEGCTIDFVDDPCRPVLPHHQSECHQLLRLWDLLRAVDTSPAAIDSAAVRSHRRSAA